MNLNDNTCIRRKIEQTVKLVRNVTNMCNLYPCNKMLILNLSSEIDAKECFQAMQKYCYIKKAKLHTVAATRKRTTKNQFLDDFKFNTLKGIDKQVDQ